MKKLQIAGLRYSEIVLLAVLLLMVAQIRIYYGGAQGLMVVWKGEPSFSDTFVNVADLQRLPKEQLMKDHRSVYWQMLAMDLLEDEAELNAIRARRARAERFNRAEPKEHQQPAPDKPPEQGRD